MRRRIGVVCLLFVLAMLNATGASAADLSQMCPEEIAFREEIGMTEDTPQEPSPYVSLITGVGLTISSSGDAACSATVTGSNSIKKIQVFLYLQEDSTRDNVTSWMQQEDGHIFSMTRHHQLKEKGTYIVKASIYVQYDDQPYTNLERYSHTDTY